MKEIFSKGNLPKHLQVMAKEFEGERSTKFFEFNTADQLLNHAKDGNCEETTVTVDKTTARGFMVAFSFKDSTILDSSGSQLLVMNIFYAELTPEESRYYSKMLSEHRDQQEDAHTKWKNKGKVTND
jgi:hypothetical protein